MAIRFDQLSFSPDVLAFGETSVMGSFRAKTGVIPNKKVSFRLTVEEGLPVFIIDPEGYEVKSYEWAQSIEQNWTFYEMLLVFVVKGRIQRRKSCQVILDARDAQNNPFATGGILYLKAN